MIRSTPAGSVSYTHLDVYKRQIQERHPEAVRPQFFRGLLAMRDGDVAGARRHLSDCVARAPHDVEIMTALVALG